MTTKIKLTAIIGICLSLLLSCTTEWTDIAALTPNEGELVRIIAYADGVPLTKTGLIDKDGGGKSVVWKSGNAISLFFISGSYGGDKFTTTTNGPVAEFLGSISAVSGDLTGAGGQVYFWGLYPYRMTASCDGQSITTTLPNNQKAYQGDVADDLLVTVGRSENLSIHFKNACSVIGFTVSQENIKKIVFSGNAQEPVAGEFNISFDDNENLIDAPTSNAVNQIVITPAETTTFVPGVTYYFALIPGTFSAGYSLAFIKADGSEGTFIREAACTFKASTFYTMTDKDNGVTFTEPLPGDSINNDGYEGDSNWDSNGNSNGNIGIGDYGNDVNWDSNSSTSGGLGINDYNNEMSWDTDNSSSGDFEVEEYDDEANWDSDNSSNGDVEVDNYDDESDWDTNNQSDGDVEVNEYEEDSDWE